MRKNEFIEEPETEKKKEEEKEMNYSDMLSKSSYISLYLSSVNETEQKITLEIKNYNKELADGIGLIIPFLMPNTKNLRDQCNQFGIQINQLGSCRLNLVRVLGNAIRLRD